MMQENEVLVKVENLSKKFCKDLKTSLWYGVKDLCSNVFGNKNNDSELRPKEFWAVKDINFELRRGECLGLIGHNGAGKSTLLKILNGLINPDEGKVTMKGRVCALIELGAGFNPILTGRENIFNNGAVLGFSKNEIDSKVEEIIDFAEIREFIDMPVQNYSSGMKVRLGFAVAAQMQPDVLIIDEVLAVGDLGFILKCFKKIDQLLPHCAVVFVSHSMPMIARVSNQILFMEKGEAVLQGKDVSEGINSYYSRFNSSEQNIMFDDETVSLIHHSINKSNNATLRRGDDLVIELEMEIKSSPSNVPLIYIEFRDKEQRPIAGLFNERRNYDFDGSRLIITIKIPNILFAKGIYTYDLSVNHFENKSPILRINNVDVFQIESEHEMWVPLQLEAEWQFIESSHD